MRGQEMGFKTEERSLRNIEASMLRVITKLPTTQTQAQLFRDIEKLLVVARQSPQWEKEKPGAGDVRETGH
jgi:hypothetical protein